LVKVSDGFHLWSERYDREMTDIFAVQDEITQAIAGVLRVKLSPRTGAPRRYVPNLRAYEAYLRARDFWFNTTKPEMLGKFKEMLERAINLDPKYALPHSFLGIYYTMHANLGSKGAREVIPYAIAAEKEALRVDPDLPEAHAMMGVCVGAYEYDWNRRCRSDSPYSTPYPEKSKQRRSGRTARLTSGICPSYRTFRPSSGRRQGGRCWPNV
jgi:hypothetical protein